MKEIHEYCKHNTYSNTIHIDHFFCPFFQPGTCDFTRTPTAPWIPLECTAHSCSPPPMTPASSSGRCLRPRLLRVTIAMAAMKPGHLWLICSLTLLFGMILNMCAHICTHRTHVTHLLQMVSSVDVQSDVHIFVRNPAMLIFILYYFYLFFRTALLTCTTTRSTSRALCSL